MGQMSKEKHIVFAFGRMNPPTAGHSKLVDKVHSEARKKGADHRVIVSHSQDKHKNPLTSAQKIRYLKHVHPQGKFEGSSSSQPHVFAHLAKMHQQGHTHVTMVAGSDRVGEFHKLINKYNGKKGRHGLYNFNKINVISAGDRDPDADDVSGMSASKMRKLASDGDFTQFSQGLPRSVSNNEAKKVYNEVRRGMGLKEQKHFQNKLIFKPVSEKREDYVKGHLFDIGDSVTFMGSDELASVTSLGSNYVIVEQNGRTYRKWIDDVELVEKKKSKEGNQKVRQDPDVKKAPGTQPAPYYGGLSKSTKKKRLAHFKKYSKYDDDNPAAYKPAPGDARAKTKPNKHTLKYRRMYGEDAVAMAKKKIEREKMVDKIKHARMLDRAKVRKIKNRSRDDA